VAPAELSLREPRAHELLDAILWAQTSAEHDALCRQAYAVAQARVEQALKDPSWTAMPEEQKGEFASLPPAVVFDADETLIDNSEYEAALITENKGYDIPLFDDKWVPLAAAKALPGAVEFTKWLREKGVEPIVITNRDEPPSRADTVKNLLALGFPLKPDGSTVLLREKARPEWREKAGRRAFVAQSYRVLLLVGDDLGDFVTVTGADLEKRRKLLEDRKDWWGVRWIVLPNPMYGSWERALYPASVKDEKERLRLKTERLRSFTKATSPAPSK
jgi:acid phosphatase